MKNKILIILALVALVLLLPIPKEQKTEEGNIVTYKAILYSVDKVSYLNENELGEEEVFVEGYVVKILGIQVYNSLEQSEE